MYGGSLFVFGIRYPIKYYVSLHPTVNMFNTTYTTTPTSKNPNNNQTIFKTPQNMHTTQTHANEGIEHEPNHKNHQPSQKRRQKSASGNRSQNHLRRIRHPSHQIQPRKKRERSRSTSRQNRLPNRPKNCLPRHHPQIRCRRSQS